MEHKEFLDQKLKSLKRKYEKNREIAIKLIEQQKIVNSKLKELTDAGAVILAKVAAITEIIQEETL